MAQEAESILVCLPTTAFGGHERMLVRLLSALSGRVPGPIIVVCADIPELLAELRIVPSVTVRIGYGPGRSVQAKLRAVLSTFRAMLSTGARMVLFAPGSIHVGRQHVLLAKLIGRRVAVYVPMCFAGSVMGYRRASLADWLTRVMGRIVDLWITISRAQQDLLESYFGIQKPVHVVPNVAAAGKSNPVVTSRRGGGRLRVVFLGRYDGYQKGLDWLCQALKESHSNWTGRICFQFFGDGEFRDELIRLATTCRPGEVTVSGWTESFRALDGADLLLLPSRFEGFPLVFIEAANAGVPILSSTFAGARELLSEGASFEFGDTTGLMSALLRMTDRTAREEVAGIQKASLDAQSTPCRFDSAVSALAQDLIVRRMGG